MIASIRSTDDIKLFSAQLIKEGLSFHPDDDFNDYININTKHPFYTAKQANRRNQLMAQCFEVCEKEGLDIYAICLGVTLTQTRLDQFIPLPILS